MDAIQFFNKWLHLLSIIGALGGIMFAWIVLRSDSASHDAPDDDALLRWKRWGVAQAVFWVVVLATGFANYVFVSPGVVGRYHMLIGMKMTLAILMFLVAMLLAHPLPAFGKLIKNKSSWLAVLITMGVVVVGISAYLNIGRVKRTLTKPAAATVERTPEVSLPGPPAP